METKTYRGTFEFKQDDESGEFTSVFATLNVVDLDGDVTLPGAFGEQEVLVEPWNHSWSQPPVGSAVIHERGDQAVAEGEFFLETENGRDHHAIAKRLGRRQEWSYSFNITEVDYGEFGGQKVRFLKKLDVIGVGQVTRGAGIDTHTEHVKGLKPYPNEHSCRLVEPDKFVRCVRKQVRDVNAVDGYEPTGLPYMMLICYTEDGKSEVQAFRYDKDVWTEEQARKHCRAHDGILFEAATEKAGNEGQIGDIIIAGEPSGPAPGVVAAQIEIQILDIGG